MFQYSLKRLLLVVGIFAVACAFAPMVDVDYGSLAIVLAVGVPLCVAAWHFMAWQHRESWRWRLGYWMLLAATFVVVPFSPCHGAIWIPAVVFIPLALTDGSESLILLAFGLAPIGAVGGLIFSAWALLRSLARR